MTESGSMFMHVIGHKNQTSSFYDELEKDPWH